MPANYRWALYRLALVLLAVLPLSAQEEPGQALPTLLRGNERFGAKLLVRLHSSKPEQNVVVSPISLTIIFAALQTHLGHDVARTEIGTTFGWGEYPLLAVPTRMLLAAFEMPPQLPRQPHGGYGRPLDGTWISNVLLYRNPYEGAISEKFLASAEKDFGIKVTSAGTHKPTAVDLAREGKARDTLPSIGSKNDALINSGGHLQTTWRGNTFSMSEPHKTVFQTASGEQRSVEMLDSELESYRYARTEAFEAVSLPCDNAYMLAVLPGDGRSLQDVERAIAETPELIDRELKRQIGFVSMPTFHFQTDADLKEQIQELGIKRVFEDLWPIIRIPKSHLAQVGQRTDIQVTKDGIRANSETVAGVVYGGIVTGKTCFHMELNRPFLFLIRDQVTNALLFIGVVMDPTQP